MNENGTSDHVSLFSRHFFFTFARCPLPFLRERNLFHVCRVRKILLPFSHRVEVNCRKRAQNYSLLVIQGRLQIHHDVNSREANAAWFTLFHVKREGASWRLPFRVNAVLNLFIIWYVQKWCFRNYVVSNTIDRNNVYTLHLVLSTIVCRQSTSYSINNPESWGFMSSTPFMTPYGRVLCLYRCSLGCKARCKQEKFLLDDSTPPPKDSLNLSLHLIQIVLWASLTSICLCSSLDRQSFYITTLL